MILLGARQAVGQPLCAIGLIVAPELIELPMAVTHYLTSLQGCEQCLNVSESSI